MTYRVVKYGSKWAVLDTKTRVYYFCGKGKRFCEDQAKELNKG